MGALSKVKVIEEQSQTVLFECDMENIEKAYRYAVELEGMGIDVKILAPSLPESLGESLGVSSFELNRLKVEIQDEIDSHGQPCASDSCAYGFGPPIDKNDKNTH